jgi:hypothetical protein
MFENPFDFSDFFFGAVDHEAVFPIQYATVKLPFNQSQIAIIGT